MVQGMIEGRVEKEKPPAAPFEDEVIIQYLLNELTGRMFESPQIDDPKKILLGFLRDGSLRVISPFQVRITNEGKNTIAEAIELDEFGFGNSVSEAIVDLQRAVAELYFTLEREQERLGVDLQKTWNVLQEKILKR